MHVYLHIVLSNFMVPLSLTHFNLNKACVCRVYLLEFILILSSLLSLTEKRLLLQNEKLMMMYELEARFMCETVE